MTYFEVTDESLLDILKNVYKQSDQIRSTTRQLHPFLKTRATPESTQGKLLHKLRRASPPLSMLEGLLLLIHIIVVSKSVDIQAHVPRNTALSPALGKAGLRIDDRVATLGGLDKLRVLLLENGKVPFRLPIPDTISREEKIHLLKSTLIRFRVQAVDHGERDDVGDTEDVICLLLQSLEDDGKDEGQPAVTNGPANDTPCVTLGTDLQWEDLSWVKPWNSEPGGAEGGREEEDHSNRT